LPPLSAPTCPLTFSALNQMPLAGPFTELSQWTEVLRKYSPLPSTATLL